MNPSIELALRILRARRRILLEARPSAMEMSELCERIARLLMKLCRSASQGLQSIAMRIDTPDHGCPACGGTGTVRCAAIDEYGVCREGGSDYLIPCPTCRLKRF